MQFLTPLFWLAATVIAVPVILHLTRREVKKPIPFSSLMFLRKIPVHEVRRRKIHHWLLLALRCLGILLLVGAFSQPVVERLFVSAVVAGEKQSVLLLVDHSLSMSRDDVWNRAGEAVSGVITDLTPGSEVCLVQFGVRAEVLSLWSEDLTQISAIAADRLEPSYEATSYAEGFRAAAAQLESSRHSRKRVVLVTDLQAAGLDLREADIEIPANVELEIKDVGEDSTNLFIERIRLERDVFGERYPHTLLVRVGSSGFGEEGPGNLSPELRLLLNDTVVDRRQVELNQQGQATVSFDPFDLNEGIVRGRLVLTSEDQLSADDVKHFVLERVSPFRVALISDGSSAQRSSFFRDAMASGTNLPFLVEDVPQVPALGDNFRVVLLNDLRRLPNIEALKDYLEQGGGLILCLGNGVDHQQFNRVLSSVLPGTVEEKKFARSTGRQFFSVTEMSAEHPVFSAFKRTGENALAPVQFYGYWSVKPDEEANVLAWFSSGDPLLIERRIGQGKVLLFTSSIDRVWSDFPLRSAYVPFWQELVRYASSWTARPAEMEVNRALPLSGSPDRLDLAESGRRDVLDPSGRRLVPLGGEGPEYVQLEMPGHYELRYDKKTDWIAVNVDTAESDVSRLEAGEFLAALKSQQVKYSSVMVNPEEDSAQESQPLWWLVLALAVGVFLGESVLSNRLGADRLKNLR